jgi:hypothetical protein
MTVYVVDLEAVETRYTAQWKGFLPYQMRNAGLDVEVISGGEVPQATTPGAFLNFAGTNSYKSQQLMKIAEMFAAGTVKDGDYFLYTDAWNPTVIQLKYMAELLGVKISIGGLWHAGSYDSQDFLGRLIGDVPWVRNAEASMFYCYDHNFFATRFHVNLMAKNLFGVETLFGEDEAEEFMNEHDKRIKIVGWPMEYLNYVLADLDDHEKKKKIIFPHRLAPEKQLEIFKDLAAEMPEYEWFVAQEQPLTKNEYHAHLAESKLMFSANLQETLGISAYEAALVGTLPLLPERLSYTEMWDHDGFYPSEWTKDWDSYQKHKPEMVNYIRHMMDAVNEDMSKSALAAADRTGDQFFSGKALYATISETQK